MTTDITLIQPRHTYAPIENGRSGHIYMPTSLLTAGARLMHAGVNVDFKDLNFPARTSVNSELCGINLVGSPYIPVAIELANSLRKECGEGFKLILGGQVVSGLSNIQFSRLFGATTARGNDDGVLAGLCKIDVRNLPRQESVSLVPAYRMICDDDMRSYLGSELSLYLSQGCNYACSFCAALRTFKDPLSGDTTRVFESYREIEQLEQDLSYLIRKAKSLGLDNLKFYLTNLDLFQTPKELNRFAQMVIKVRSEHTGFTVYMRGLSTAKTFLSAHKAFPEVINNMVRAGLERVGFGIDGADESVWKALNKGHNTRNLCVEAVRVARNQYQLTPEALMVFGYPDLDTAESLNASVNLARALRDNFGANLRPHVAKICVPGNDGWRDPNNAKLIEALMRYPKAFQCLDFTALPNEITHPNSELCALATKIYLEMCGLDGNTTKYVRPMLPGMSEDELMEVRQFNLAKYDF